MYEVNPAPKTEKHLRPHEAEVIKKSGEIKVDDKDKEVFEEVQKIVEDQELKEREHSEGTIISAVSPTSTLVTKKCLGLKATYTMSLSVIFVVVKISGYRW